VSLWAGLAAASPSGAAAVLVTVHQRLGYALLAVLAAGVVLAALAVRDAGRLPTLRAYLWLAVAAVAVQGIAGISLLLAGQRPAQGLHLMYGPLALVSLPLALLFTRGWGPRREAWALAAGFVITLLLAFRAVTTG